MSPPRDNRDDDGDVEAHVAEEHVGHGEHHEHAEQRHERGEPAVDPGDAIERLRRAEGLGILAGGERLAGKHRQRHRHGPEEEHRRDDVQSNCQVEHENLTVSSLASISPLSGRAQAGMSAGSLSATMARTAQDPKVGGGEG